jgi:XTP/dITP diphosphohydrolase
VGARYSCAAAFVDGDVEVVAMGETFGKIVREPKGEHGFGYDPYFFSTELGMTFGEASVEAKQTVSHRGRAFRALVVALRERRGGI